MKTSEHKIIEVALSVFSKKGLMTSANEIAKEVPCSKSNIFYHFKSMDNLYRCAFDHYSKLMNEYMFKELPKNKSCYDKLKHIWDLRYRWALKYPDAMRLIYTRYALKENDKIEYNKGVRQIISSGVYQRELRNLQNHYYMCCLFYSSSNSIILSMIGKSYGVDKKTMNVNKAFQSFYLTVKSSKNEDEDEF